MLKRLFLGIYLASICIVFAQAGDSLLRNGDFSEGLSYWTVTGDRPGVTIEEGAAPGGGNALKLVSSKEHYVANYSLSRQQIKEDTDYTVSGKIKSEGNADVYLFFCRSPQADQYHSKSQVLKSSSDWGEVNILLNSGKAKGMPLICRVVGQGTGWFADLQIREGNHLPAENIFLNSDFKSRTRYKDVPDGWSPAVQTRVATPDDYIFELVDIPPPVAGAGVIKAANVIFGGQKIQQPVPGQTYTFSFYAKNAEPGAVTELAVRYGTKSQTIKLSDEWQRFSFTEQLRSAWPANSVRARKSGQAFYYSAPQFVIGSSAVPWTPPQKTKSTAVIHIKEAVAEAESRKTAAQPVAADWSKAPAYPIDQVSRGKAEAVIPSTAKILHNDEYIFVLFEGKESPSIKVGDTSKIDWGTLCDTFELFLTDTANDGTFIQYCIDRNGNDYTARNMTPELLGIQAEVAKKTESWTALVKVPLSLFKSNRDWKIAFGRCYDHLEMGRTALDWSMPGSRHNTANFGFLRGISITPVASLELEKLYASVDRKRLCYEFVGFEQEMQGSTLQAKILLAGKTLWQTEQPLEKVKGELLLPENYEEMIETSTRLSLEVTGKGGKKYYQASRVLYLLFSSYARCNQAMEVFPKYDLFSEKDAEIKLLVNLDKTQFDKLRITLLDEQGKAAYSRETDGDLLIASSSLADGTYTIQVEALKGGQIVDLRAHESFRKLPFRPEMIRLDRELRCLSRASGNFMPMSYYASDSSGYAYDPDLSALRDAMFEGAKKAGFNSLKKGFYMAAPEVIEGWLAQTAKHDMPFLIDMAQVFPRGYYGSFSSDMSGTESEKILLEYTHKLQQICFGKAGIFAYAPYHEPGYFRNGKGIIDSYRVAAILPELKKHDPYRPITGFWAPPHWDSNGEPFGSIDGADFFIVDVYTRNLKKHCDELFRIAKASRVAHRPIGQIFNIDNLGSADRECPTPAEYRAEVYTALIAGYRVFYNYIGIAPVRETWREMVECNYRLQKFTEILCNDSCREITVENEADICYAVYKIGKETLLLAASKQNDGKTNLKINLEKLTGHSLADGKDIFDNTKIAIDKGNVNMTLPPAGTGAWMFKKK